MSDGKANSKPEELSPQQVRAARALLAWSQQDLAKSAGVAQSTVADFERAARTPVPNNAEAIKKALTEAGVNFLPGGAVIGPPIPPLKGASTGGGVRLINATDLEQWAARRDAQGAMPVLLAKLAAAAIGPGAEVSFPADESIQLPGWDGVTAAASAAGYVPAGSAGWEIGVQRSGIGSKAQADYDKRTVDPGHLARAETTFVFVTPRTWAAKDVWAKDRRAEKNWRDVRAYDATDLVQWIGQHPAIGLWLAVSMGKRPQGAHQLEEVWAEWSLATRWPLSEDLVLADRDKEAAQVLSWLRDEPSVLALKAETADEAAAFVYAAIKSLPEATAAHYLSRAVMATNADTARALGDGADPLIIVLLDPDPGLAQRMALAGHYVLLAYGDGEHGHGELTTLPRPSREGMSAALTAMGIARDRAEVLARDAARSLAVLRRLIPGAPGRLPRWAAETPPRALLAAMLAGSWNEENEADKRVLERLSGMSYAAFAAALTPYISALDSPLRKVGEAWKVASPRDAWFLLAQHLSAADVDTFQAIIIDVLGAADPRFELKPDERWMASFDGVTPEFSGWIRHGLGETLILLSLFGDRVLSAHDGTRRAQYVVRALLNDANAQRWWSLSRDFRLLAEASPGTFMDMVEASLSKNDPPIAALFGVDDDPMFGSENISNLLWALETLAWSPRYVSRVAELLARLDAIDPGESRFLNRPANSLRHIFLLWSPQTFATYEERLRVIDRLRHAYPAAAWKLLLKILPKGHDSSSPTPQPHWLDFSEWRRETVTYQTLRKGAVAITERVIEDAGEDAKRWAELIDRLPDFAPDCSAAIERLGEVAKQITAAADVDLLRTELRDLLHRHRTYQDADWAMRPEKLDVLEAVYESLAPQDLVSRYAWLFRNNAHLPQSRVKGWRAAEEELLEMRKRAALELFTTSGVAALFSVAAETSTAGFIGVALRQPGISEAQQQEILRAALQRDNSRERDIAYGLISATFRDMGEPWAEALMARAQAEDWGAQAIITILRALPQRRWTWNLAASAGAKIEREYWMTLPILWMEGEAADIEFAARKLMEVRRAHHAVHMVGHELNKNLSTEVLVEVLRRAIGDAKGGDPDEGNEATMFQYHVAEILKVLDGRADVDEDTLFSLEWAYLRVLEYSGRRPLVLLKALAERPEFFIEVIKAIFRPSEESGVVDEPPADAEHAQSIASQAYELLRVWDRVPGSDDNGQVEHAKLSAWVRRARILAAEAGREDIADQKIGDVMSASAVDPDGAWPQRAIRDVIEEVRSEELERGFSIGLYNRRGVTTRGMRDGGQQERDLAAQYRVYANATALEWPRTAALLESIAQDYEREARSHDERAERLDWRY